MSSLVSVVEVQREEVEELHTAVYPEGWPSTGKEHWARLPQTESLDSGRQADPKARRQQAEERMDCQRKAFPQYPNPVCLASPVDSDCMCTRSGFPRNSCLELARTAR